jgi:uncharacterized tellurite resistance protein B-like protein
VLTSLLERFRGSDNSAEEHSSQLLPLAAATLLIEVAWADHNISADELAIVRTTLATQFNLTGADADQIIEESRAHQENSVGLFAFTRTLVEAWDEAQRFELIVQLWRLAFSDAQLDRFEEHMIRKIAESLYVSHARFIEAKQTARKPVVED